MSIRPIDYINLISKSQDMVRLQQEENIKQENQLEGNILQNNKTVRENMKRVQDTDKSQSLVINNNNKRNQNNKRNKGRKKKEKNKELKHKSGVGGKIDIKV